MIIDSTPLRPDMRMNPPCRSMAGILHLDVVDVRAVERVVYCRGVAVVVLKDGAEWLRVECAQKEASTRSTEGHAYEHTVEATWAARARNPVATLDEMREARWLVRKTDRNGDQWLYGTLEEPMRFDWDETDEGLASGLSCYELRWQCMSRMAAQRTSDAELEEILLATEDEILVATEDERDCINMRRDF